MPIWFFAGHGSPGPASTLPELHIAAGEHVFLHGPSGSGKSTLLGLLGGVALPERGSLEVLGHEMTKLSGRARDRLRADSIGFLFQQFNLLPWLPAHRQRAAALHLFGAAPAARR